MLARPLLVLLLTLGSAAPCAGAGMGMTEGMLSRGNPVRKVVNLLQAMAKKVEAEAKKDEDMHGKFMCYCTGSGGSLTDSVEAAKVKVPELESVIKQVDGKLSQLEKDLEGHRADEAGAKKAMAEATAVREKAAADFAKEKSESVANIDGVTKAVKALEAGMGADSFMQSSMAGTLRTVLTGRSSASNSQGDAQEVLEFLGGNSEAPGTGEIVGILKQMLDEMQTELAEATAEEEKAIKGFQDLITAKKRELKVLTKMIEEKLGRAGQLEVQLATTQNDLEDTQTSLAEDEKFLKDLAGTCAQKTKEFELRKKMRGEELAAIGDTIKVLNDDDALDLFKKTLPSASSSFLQIQVSAAQMRAEASAVVRGLRKRAKRDHRARLDFIALAMRGRKVGFEKVIQMIDELIATIKQEQVDDDAKKEYCAAEFDASDDKKKALGHAIDDLGTVLAEAQEGIENLGAEIAALTTGIKKLDAQVKEATEQRKKEHEEHKELVSSNTAAKELFQFAKNRLAKFYNPKMYKAPPKRELSEEDRISVNMGGTMAPTTPGGIAGTGISASFLQVHMHADAADEGAPPAPPETMGAYQKKSEDSMGVLAMIDLLIKDLDKELTEGAVEEKHAQAEYETMIKDAAEKRADDAKSLTDKEAAKASMQGALEDSKGEMTSAEKELKATNDYIISLHGECDFLLKYFDTRKTARADEVDSLGKAKDVLSGADYSLLQTGHRSRRVGAFLLHRAR